MLAVLEQYFSHSPLDLQLPGISPFFWRTAIFLACITCSFFIKPFFSAKDTQASILPGSSQYTLQAFLSAQFPNSATGNWIVVLEEELTISGSAAIVSVVWATATPDTASIAGMRSVIIIFLDILLFAEWVSFYFGK